jgi:hypothetical protein
MQLRELWKFFACALSSAVIVAIPIALIIALGWRFPVILAILLATLVSFAAWMNFRALRRFRTHYGPLGKDVILVYSNSPHWSEYIESHWIPRWGARLVVVNLSQRNGWRRETSPEAAVVGRRRREPTHPLVVVVPRSGNAKHFSFRTAFHKRKFGDGVPLASMEAELEKALASSGQYI